MNKILIIKIFTFLGGIFFFLEYLFPSFFSQYNEIATACLLTIGGLAFGMGLINILQIHGKRILLKQENYFFSAALIISLVVSLIIHSADWYFTEKEQSVSRALSLVEKELAKPNYNSANLRKYIEANLTEYANSQEYKNFINSQDLKSDNLAELKNYINDETEANKQWVINILDYIQKGLFTPLGASMFSLLGFYIATASYRAFRITSIEAALMMFAALIVMLGQTALGHMISPIFTELRYWLLTVPNAAAFRAIEIGTSIAGLVLAIRMWLSLDSQDS